MNGKSVKDKVLDRIKYEIIRQEWNHPKDHYLIVYVHEKHNDKWIEEALTKMKYNVTVMPVITNDEDFIIQYYITW